jgi:hypothetical protein
MYYVYVSKTDTEPVRFEDVNTASAFIMNQSQPTETLLFNEETHARFLARREGSKHTGRIKELMELHDCSRPWACELLRREQAGHAPLEPKRRGPKLSIERLRAKIVELEARLAEYRQQLVKQEERDDNQAGT